MSQGTQCTLSSVVSMMLMLAAAVAVPPAVAQTGADVLEVEEVLVTARKREESLMEIPVAVEVVDSAEIESANITDLEGIAQVTPGFKLNNAFGRQADRPVIRGLSGISTGVELAGFFVDGIYVAGSLKSFDLDSLDRVEVIKGPQAAVFGRRTFTGAVNYVTAAPSDEHGVRVKAEYGSNDRMVFGATASGTEGRIGYRATVRSSSYDGDFDNTIPGGPDVGGEETLSFNGTVIFDATDATSIRVNMSYADDEDDQYAILLQPSSENNCVFGDDMREYFCGTLDTDLPVSLGGLLNNDVYGVERDRFRSSVRVDHDFNDSVSASVTAAYNNLNYYAGQDQTFGGLQTSFDFATFGQVPANEWHTRGWSDTEDTSIEAWLRGTAVEDRLTWAAGIYRYNEEESGKSINGDDSLASDFSDEITNTAYMGSLEYDFTDTFRAGVELRYAEDEVERGPFDGPTEFSCTEKSTTHRVTGSYDLNVDTLLYGNWATGVLPCDFNTDSRLPDNLVTIGEQEMEQFELGVKTSLTPNFSLIASIYQLEWKDQRRSEFIIIDGIPVGYAANQGTTDIMGFELSGTWNATENLTLTAATSYNDSEVNDFVSDDSTDIAITGDGDVSGAQLPLSPELEGHFAVLHNLPLANGMTLDSRIDVSYQDSRYVRLVNQAETGSETIVNLNIGLSRDNWTVSLYGKNVTDEDAPVSALRYIEADSFFFGGRAFAITPRPGPEYGVRAVIDF